jgi:hypothetical protein
MGDHFFSNLRSTIVVVLVQMAANFAGKVEIKVNLEKKIFFVLENNNKH